jgi:hypothetical protein
MSRREVRITAFANIQSRRYTLKSARPISNYSI